jgi:hypothetical protein
LCRRRNRDVEKKKIVMRRVREWGAVQLFFSPVLAVRSGTAALLSSVAADLSVSRQ